MIIEYQNALAKHNEFEVMRESTAELFSHNVAAVMNSKMDDIKAMASNPLLASVKNKRHPSWEDYQQYLIALPGRYSPLSFDNWL